MLGKIFEFICVYAISSGKLFENSKNYSSSSSYPSEVQNDDEDEEEWVPCYMKPINYDEDDE